MKNAILSSAHASGSRSPGRGKRETRTECEAGPGAPPTALGRSLLGVRTLPEWKTGRETQVDSSAGCPDPDRTSQLGNLGGNDRNFFFFFFFLRLSCRLDARPGLCFLFQDFSKRLCLRRPSQTHVQGKEPEGTGLLQACCSIPWARNPPQVLSRKGVVGTSSGQEALGLRNFLRSDSSN